MTDTPNAKLITAIAQNDMDKFHNAIALGADPNHRTTWIDADGDSHNNIPAVTLAIMLGNEDMACRLLEAGSSPFVPWYTDYVLGRAVKSGMKKFVDQTVAEGYSLDQPGGMGARALDIAIAADKPDMFKYLLAKGSSINPPPVDVIGSMPPLFRIGDATEMRYAYELLDAGADTKPKDFHGRTESPNATLAAVLDRNTIAINRLLSSRPIDPQQLVQGGKARPILNRVLGAHRLPELFKPSLWEGRQQAALELFDQIRSVAPPYYKAELTEIDLTALSNQALEATPDATRVGRYVRPSTPDRGRV